MASTRESDRDNPPVAGEGSWHSQELFPLQDPQRHPEVQVRISKFLPSVAPHVNFSINPHSNHHDDTATE